MESFVATEMTKPTSMNVLKARLIKDLIKCGETLTTISLKAVDDPWDLTNDERDKVRKACKRFAVIKANSKKILDSDK